MKSIDEANLTFHLTEIAKILNVKTKIVLLYEDPDAHEFKIEIPIVPDELTPQVEEIPTPVEETPTPTEEPIIDSSLELIENLVYLKANSLGGLSAIDFKI